MTEKDNNLFRFMIREKYITLTTLGSIFTFAFISSFKEDIVDPLINFILTNQNFDFMNITIREGEKMDFPERQIELKIGHFFISFITWLLLMTFLFALNKFTSFPDTNVGNISGAAVM
jgi:large-conductance mechanosensitive channel